MAKRIQFAAYGGPEVLEYRDYQPAEPGPREVRVRNRAIGLNFIDTYYRSGLYPAPGLPSGLGSEGAGEVEAVGSEVTRFKVGDRVAYATGPLGAYSELHVLAEEKLVHLPDGIDFEQAAAVMLKGLTTQYLLRQTYELRGGETILFHAAAGGVGLFACQWAKALGVQLIGTVSSPEKARLARQHGAWETIDYAGRRQPAVLGQGHAILDPLARLRLVDLRGAGVGTDHPFETLGQQHRKLSGAAAAVQGQAGAGAERGQLVDQPRRVGRTMCGVVRRTGGEMILERCRHGTLPK
ncbi:quinone oxidoreductase [Pseudomonas aeruginosa VRFPA09]|nr:quinone oxidoreductase [Pseudomonas aeruginosa VRFPA09]